MTSDDSANTTGSGTVSASARTAELLDLCDTYLDAVPRSMARTEDVGPFTLFIKNAPDGWMYYARPGRFGSHSPPSSGDVQAVLARQQALEVSQEFEWIAELCPTLADTARAVGLEVHTYPLLVLEVDPVQPLRPGAAEALVDVQVRSVPADDPRTLQHVMAVQHLGFSAPGTDRAAASEAERDAIVDEQHVRVVAANIAAGRTVVAAALSETSHLPVCAGMHQPVTLQPEAASPETEHESLAKPLVVSEIVGVATLPAYRRQGLAAALTRYLVQDAIDHGANLLLLSAGSDDVARIYESVGFRRIGHACAAAPPASVASKG